MVRAIIDQILEYGDVRRGSLGIALQDPTSSQLESVKQQPQRHGASVVKVDRQSTAEHAGLKVGDVVNGINGVPVHDASHLRANLALLRIGKVAELAVLREGRPLVIYATVAPEQQTKSK
jgi:serine protease DegQ